DDAALASLAKLPAVQTLSLRNTRMRGESLEPLAAAKRLEVLNLTRCPIDKLDTTSLAKLPRLATLNLYQPPLSADVTADLAKLLRQRKGGVYGAARPWRNGPVATVASEPGAAPTIAPASTAADVLPPANVRFAPDAMPTAEVPDFQRHVVTLLGRLGCNGRA